MSDLNLNTKYKYEPPESSIQMGHIKKIHEMCEKAHRQRLSKSEICLNCSTFLLGIDSIISVIFEKNTMIRSWVIISLLMIAIILYFGYLYFRKIENDYFLLTIDNIVNLMPMTKEEVVKELKNAETLREDIVKSYKRNYDSP